MPKTTKSGKPKQDELPSTIARSGSKAQRTFAKAHDSAADQYDDEERANRVAYAAVKHTHEKVGDHWERTAPARPTRRPRVAWTPTARRPAGWTPTRPSST